MLIFLINKLSFVMLLSEQWTFQNDQISLVLLET